MFEEYMKELNEIVEKLESGNIGVEESIELFKRGSELSKNCMKIIQEGKIISTESINELKHDNNSKYIIELNKLDDIDKFLKEKDQKLENNFIEVNKNKEDISDFIFELLKSGYKVYQVKEKEKSLEQAFLERIGGDNNDKPNKK